MAFVYKYVDIVNNAVYVGKVSSDDVYDLYKRHRQHMSNDFWCEPEYLRLFVIRVKTESEADGIETEMIRRYSDCSLANKQKVKYTAEKRYLKIKESDWVKIDFDLGMTAGRIKYQDNIKYTDYSAA